MYNIRMSVVDHNMHYCEYVIENLVTGHVTSYFSIFLTWAEFRVWTTFGVLLNKQKIIKFFDFG